MITWFFCIILISWCIYKRAQPDGKVEGKPLGMPRGTVRALITILIVAFPFSYLMTGEPIPSLIINSLFLLVAFYFEARKGTQDKIKQIISEVKSPEAAQLKSKAELKPLYLPKYTVRIILITMLALIVIINTLGPNIPFESTNTLVDLFLIISAFIIGSFFRAFGNSRQSKKIHGQVMGLDYRSLTKYEILEEILGQKPSWWKEKGENLLSFITLAAIIAALLFYSLNLDYVLLTLPFYELSLREALLLFVSVYYGLRD